MSRQVSVYVGPFAMLPEEVAPSADELAAAGGAGLGLWPANVVEPGSEPQPSRFSFYLPDPYQPPRPGGPARALYFDREPSRDLECVGADCLALDREAEVAAFRSAFAQELAALAGVAGREPVLGWGLVFAYG